MLAAETVYDNLRLDTRATTRTVLPGPEWPARRGSHDQANVNDNRAGPHSPDSSNSSASLSN